MRSIWKGEVSFGLVNVPVKVYSATEDHDLHARQVDKKDGVRIRYKKVRDDDGEEVEFSDIAKAYESEDGEMEFTPRRIWRACRWSSPTRSR